jgi:hypothetical protein
MSFAPGRIARPCRPFPPAEISCYIDGMGLSPVNRILTRLAFKGMLLKRAYTKGQFQHMSAKTEFSNVEILESDIGLEISMMK